MNHPPPNLRDVMSMRKPTDSVETTEHYLWEIGVPPKKSLYWSIVLSYLWSSDDNRLSEFLNTISSGRKGKKTAYNFNLKAIKDGLKNFNPFKNRHVFFHEDEVQNVMRAFKVKLNQHATKIQVKGTQWNDDRKLFAASDMLDCSIEVYFPDEVKPNQYRKYGEKKTVSVVIFQYKDKEYGARKENINIFRFAITIDRAHTLKLSALKHILKKTSLAPDDISHIEKLMKNNQTHGQNFLPTILQSPHCNVISHFYASPYVALKLSEAGFETNLAKTNPQQPSALLYAASKGESSNTGIIYDYTANCRYLFDKTIRDANETILDSLKVLHNIFVNDMSAITYCTFEKDVEERTRNILEEYFHFLEYQKSVAISVMKLRNELDENLSHEDVFRARKEFFRNMLDCYSNILYYKLEKTDIACKYNNYLKFSEYYKNVDNFFCVSFFDNILLLKETSDLKNSDIESSIFLFIESNKIFPKFEHDVECKPDHNKTECTKQEQNFLRYIPLIFRENLQEKLNDFRSDLIICNIIPNDKKRKFPNSLSFLPEIRDKILINRVQIYLEAATEVSFQKDGSKGIFAIERALQVLGESLKDQSTLNCVVSSLLCSQLPPQIKYELIKIRDKLSHFQEKFARGRLELQKNIKLFEDLQKELIIIKQSFEVVSNTQDFRIEKYLVKYVMPELLRHQVDQNMIKESVNRLSEQMNLHRDDCALLSLHISKYLQERMKYYLKNSHLDSKKKFKLVTNIENILNSVAFLFEFMCEKIDKSCFQPHFQLVDNFCKSLKNGSTIDNLIPEIDQFCTSYQDIVNKSFQISDNLATQFPVLHSFLACSKQSAFSISESNLIMQAVKDSYDEADEACKELEDNIKAEIFDLTVNEKLLKKLIISQATFEKLKGYCQSKKKKCVLNELKKKKIERDSLEKEINDLLNDNFSASNENLSDTDDSISDAKPTESRHYQVINPLLIKLANQRYLKHKIYGSVTLHKDICKNLETFLIRKVHFLLSSVAHMKSILIDEDEDIKEAWKWGRSKEMKYHMRFLMRQRFLQEMEIRASLEFAFFDCLNILKNKQFCDIYEKANNLFTGINLRNVLSHGHSILDTAGCMLDKDDFPSELITKMLSIIEDAEVITKMLKLIPDSSTLYEKEFITFIEKNEDDLKKEEFKKITRCIKWKDYVFLLPLI